MTDSDAERLHSSIKQVGRYELLAELVKSHVGSVWAGRAVEGEHAGSVLAVRPLALKFPVTPKTAGPIIAAATECVGAELDHVVPVVEVQQLDGEIVIASALVQGSSLGELLRLVSARKLPSDPAVALRILSDLLLGLQGCHAAGWYRPGGLIADSFLVGSDGLCWLFEPGIAAALNGVGAWARHRECVSYASPELVTPGAAVTHVADLFSIGVVAWELLAAKKLYGGLGYKSVADKIVGEPAPRLDAVPEGLASVVARALERDPAARFPSAEAMLEALSTCGIQPASHHAVADLVSTLAGSMQRMRHLRSVTAQHRSLAPPRPSSLAAGDLDVPPMPQAPAVRAPWRARPTSSMALVGSTGRSRSAPPQAHDRSEMDTVVPAGRDAAEDSSRSREMRRHGTPLPSVLPAMPSPDELLQSARQVGRCELFAEIAHGGMATIHLGRWVGAGGFAKTVAVKALHAQYARDPDFVKMFLDEARVVARIRHPNVMPTIDLVDEGGELFIVMDYVQGVTLANLMRTARRKKQSLPVDIVLRVMSGVLHGLHAAHEAKNARGEPMSVIHRDVSPDNILIGVDGYARVIDFGIATAMGRFSATRDGQVKGKLAYLTPEAVLGESLDRRADVYSASVVLWQALTGKRLFRARSIAEVTHRILTQKPQAPGEVAKGLSQKLDAIVLKGLERSPDARWATAEDMAEALEKLGGLASHREVGRWVSSMAAERLERSAAMLKLVETAPVDTKAADLTAPLTIKAAASKTVPPGLRGGWGTLDGEESHASGIHTPSDAHPLQGQPAPAGTSMRLIAMVVGGVVALGALVAWLLLRMPSEVDETQPDATPTTRVSAPAPVASTAPESRVAAPEPSSAPADAGGGPEGTETAQPSATAAPLGPPTRPWNPGKRRRRLPSDI
jgi:serine/threonine-protein kinase